MVAKSLGTLAMPVVNDLSLPGVWLTPNMTDPALVAAGADHSLELPGDVPGPVALLCQVLVAVERLLDQHDL